MRATQLGYVTSLLNTEKKLGILKKHIFFLILILAVFANANLYGQGTNCLGATPLCSSVTTTFPGTIGGTVPTGNNYGCLFTQANPSWFTLTVGTSGTTTLNQTAPCDQDYAVWGPFSSLSAACAGLTAAPVSCSFSPASGNTFTLPAATTGQIFIMLLSNYGGCTGNVSISEAAGGGSLSCVPVCGVTASSTGPYCSGATITLNATTANGATAYNWTGPNGYTATGQNVTIPNSNTSMAGLYTVTATGLATCTSSAIVVVNPTPQLNVTSNSPVCTGTPLSLSSGLSATPGLQFVWQGPGPFISLSANPTIANPQLSNSGNFTLTAQFSTGCSSQQIIPVVVNPAPTVTAITPISICSGGTVPAQTFTGNASAATYTWTNNQPSIGLAASGSAGFPSFTATNNTANPITATVSVVPHLGSCNGAASNFTITVSPAPTITTPVSNVYCEGGTVPAITWATSSPTATVAWTNNNTATGMGASGTGSIPTFVASQVNTQTISTITATPSQGACVGTPVSFSLTVNNAPSAIINDIGPLCSNVGFQTLTAATPGGIWSGPGIINTSSGLFDPLIPGAGIHTLTYTLNLPNQCLATDITQIQIINVPNANAGPDQSVCQGQTVNLNGSFTNSSTGAETFAWTPTTNLTNTTTLTPTYTANSTQTYSLTVTSGICSSTNNVVVTMLPQSNATINAGGPYCADVAPVVLTAAQTGGSWSGPGITNASSGAFNPALANVGNNTITYSIAGSCPSTDTQVIVIYAVPNGTITPAGPFCQSALPVTLTAATPGGTWSGAGINNPATGSFGSTTLAANTYAITYTTSGNCPRTFNQNIVVNASSNATITAAGPYCSDDAAVVLVAAQTGGTWSGSGITNTSTGAFNPSVASSGSNVITYSIGGPCPSTDTQVIVVNSFPNGTITPAGPFCQSDLPFTLTAASSGGIWSGTGINNTATGSFGSTTLAANTYTVTYNTGGNCPQIFTQNIVVNANTNATISPAGPYCADVAPVVLIAAQAGGTWSGSGITNSVTGAFNPALATAGNNTITYSISGACPSSDIQSIVIYSVPNGTITPAGPFCQSDLPFTLAAASSGGTWSGTGISNTATGSFGSQALPANTYTVTYNTGGNCPNNFTETIVVNANFDATITPQSNICADAASINFAAVDLGGVWSGNGITNASTGAFNPASVTPGVQTITYIISGACPDTDTQTIEVYPVYDGTITPAGPFCQALLPITLSAASTGGTWSGTGINSSATGSFGSTSLAGNSYTVTYTTAGSCPRVFNETIVVNANVDATISNINPLCADVAPFNLTAAETGGIWSGTGITDAASGTFDPSIAVGNQTITYTIPGSCPSTDTQAITVYAVYDGTITPAGPFCQSDLPVTLSAASTGGTWTGTGISSASAGTFGSASLAANTYTITYTTQGNCSQTSTTTIVVNANVDATISAVADLCNDAAAINLSAADAGGTWSGQGVNATGIFAPNSVTPAIYTITYSIGGACPDTDTQDIVVLSVPDGTITPAGPFCQDVLPQMLSAASTGGTWSGTGITSAANGTFGASNTPAGNYSITYTTAGACSNSFNQVVQVIENLNATIGSAGPFCEDSSPVTITSASPGGVWSGTGAITAGGQIVPSVLGAGTYTFNYNINNSGCLSSDNIQVIVNALPQPSFTASATDGCSPLSVTFTNTSNPLGSSCVWYVNGTPAGSGNTLNEIFTGSSCEDIGIMITDAAGCNQSVTMTDLVCVNPNPSASFVWSPIEPILGGSVVFENTSLGGTTYSWDINGQAASGETVTYNVPSAITEEFQACLEVVGLGGCMDAQCYTVSVSSESFIFVPNSFSPDADGTNDVFAPVIVGLTSDSRYSFKVFNRWGDVIFETNDPNDVWTGDVNGGNFYAQPDAYVYEITLQLRPGESPFRKVGSIVLIR
jgi:gliding motility-associated-like protein